LPTALQPGESYNVLAPYDREEDQGARTRRHSRRVSRRTLLSANDRIGLQPAAKIVARRVCRPDGAGLSLPTAYDHGAASRVDRFWLQMIVLGCSRLQKSSARRVCRRLQFCKRVRRLPAAGCDHNIPTARVYRYPLRDRSPGYLEAIGSNGSHGGACWNVRAAALREQARWQEALANRCGARSSGFGEARW
jgi:hypothetical protein